MDPMQIYQMILGMQQQGQPQIPNAQMGAPQMPQRPQVQPMSAPPAPQAPQNPSMGGQLAQGGASAAATYGATAINPLLGALIGAMMPTIMQSLFGNRPKQQMPSAQVIPAPR